MTKTQSHRARAAMDMLRSFCVMANTLNLSRAAKKLGVTRQTVKRHLETIERIRNEKLFRLENRSYILTDAGKAALQGAEIIVAKGQAWLNSQYDMIDDLTTIRIGGREEEPIFYSQQHPLTRIWKDGAPLLRKGLQCWVDAQGAIESREFSPIRPYILVFRRRGNEWLCTEIGEESALARWHGWAWAKSSIGRHVAEIPSTSEHSEYILDAYEHVRRTGSPRLDHQFRRISKRTGGPLYPIRFQRLLLQSTFPDGEPAIVSIVEKTDSIAIADLDNDKGRENAGHAP